MRKFSKILMSYTYRFLVAFKVFFSTKKEMQVEVQPIQLLLEKYSWINKVVVLCNGPSANLFKPSNDTLYLVTNSGSKLVKDLNFIYYVNDPFYINKLLASDRFLKPSSDVIFYYNNTDLHKKSLMYLSKNINLLRQHLLFFLSPLLSNSISQDNFKDFISFYEHRSLSVKVQNSGMFLLLFGYFLSYRFKVPIEIYGLDMGEGGKVHFDGKGIIGDSVIAKRVKKNIRIYLDFIYKEYGEKVKNHSYFYSNLED